MTTSPSDTTGSDRVVPLRGVRGMIADKMVESLQTAAQLTHHASANATGLLAHKAALTDKGVKVSVEDLLMHVLVQVIGRHRDINGTVKEREIHLPQQIDLCVAIALPGNLLAAPAIFDCEGKSVLELRAARQDLAARALENRLSVTEMTGGTFTISNLGLSRVEYFTPILNAPQIAILGIGCMHDRPVQLEGGGIGLNPHFGLSLTFDHRAIDGAPAAEMLSDLCSSIEALS